MEAIELNVERPLQLTITGKFVSLSPQWKHMSRILTDFQLFIPSKGTLYIADELSRYEIQEGDYLLMPPLTRQYGYRESDCSFYWLHVLEHSSPEANPPGAEAAPPARSLAIPPTGTLRNKEKLIVMMKQLQDSVRSYNDPLLNNYLATSVLCELHNQVGLGSAESRPEIKKRQLYNDIADYVKWHRFEPLQVNQIADHFGYNAKYLSRMFASMSGVSLKRYIMQQKIDAAAFLLTDTNMTVTEISMQLGYHDNHHFMKSFKLLTGVTPSEYRNASAARVLNH
ncbi:helix-turn-helix transcriptional regulator [Paenibacillus sp. 1P07SE]|uniref:AraC family transcriptional regulator n=1 Tax=Paenibacillus sp. 1P07SE TaxID=3132209 RepID=UPI0039A6D171